MNWRAHSYRKHFPLSHASLLVAHRQVARLANETGYHNVKFVFSAVVD
jgi:hypothetical protein